MLQYRQRNYNPNLRDAHYSPQRDLAHVGIPIMRSGIVSLEPRFWEEWFTKFLYENELDKNDLAQGALLLIKAMELIVKTKNPPEALAQVGFDQLRPDIQAAVYARMGQVLLASVWESVKDVSSPESAPPLSINDLCAAVDDVLLQEKKSLWQRIGSAVFMIFGRFRTAT